MNPLSLLKQLIEDMDHFDGYCLCDKCVEKRQLIKEIRTQLTFLSTLKSHAEQIKEIFVKYKLKRRSMLSSIELIHSFEDELIEIDECVNAEG
jgi:hypothetical protein